MEFDKGIAICAMLAALAIGGSGCETRDGGDSGASADTAPAIGRGLPPEVRHPAATAIDKLQRSFVARDYAGVCAGLTAAAAGQAGEAGHGHATTCVRDVERLFGMIREGGGWRYSGAPRVVAIDADGSKAVAIVALDRRWEAKVPMTRVRGRWRLSGFFGVPTPVGRQIARHSARASFPSSDGTPLKVSDAAGSPCGNLIERRYPQVGGGCRVTLSGRVAPVGMLTALGYFKFEDCTVDYRFRVDASGRTLIEDFEVEGVRAACGDVKPCTGRADVTTPAPWRGRLLADGRGRYVHRSSMCLWTCVGTFVGELTVRLTRDDDGWRAEPIDGGGNSGFRFDQPLAVRGGFVVKTAGT